MDEGGERPPSCGWSNDASTIRGFARGSEPTKPGSNEMSTLSATSQLPLDKMSTHCFLLEQTASQLNVMYVRNVLHKQQLQTSLLVY
ncbi:hypothetical protein AAMO2058_000888100 [Amorphochlora amoebiformis]